MRPLDLSRAARAEVEDWVQLLPNLVKLIGRLARDRRVPWRHKAVLVGVVAYVLSPLDVLPDYIPVLGQLDEVALIAFALRALLTEVDDEVVRSHWNGNTDLLELVQAIVERSTEWLPDDVLTWLNKKSAPGTVDGRARPLGE